MRQSGYKIISRVKHPKGILLRIGVKNKNVELLITNHALDRITLWGLSEEQVLDTLLYPQEVLIGHYERYIAHKLYGMYVVRAIYEYQGEIPVLITVYRPLASRYFEGEKRYEDKILA